VRRTLMRRLARHRSTAFAALLAWCTGMPLAGQVLCIGESHVAVELAGARDGECAHPEPGAEHADHAWCAEEGCGPCHDEQLGDPGFGTRLGTARDAIASTATAVLATVGMPYPPGARTRARGAAQPSAAWTQLRPTIVLQV
jgi:hypothetical protein